MTQFTGNLELRVLDGDGAEHVLTSAAGLRAGERRSRASVENGEVRQGDVSIEALGSTFVGASGRATLPPPSVPGKATGGYRAVLAHKGAVVLDGVVPRAAIEHHVRLGVWTSSLIAAASEDFWNRLEDVRLLDLHGAGGLFYREMPWWGLVRTTVGTNTGRFYARSDLFGLSPEKCRFYNLYTVLIVALYRAGVALNGSLPDWEYSVVRNGDVLTRTETPYITSRAGYKPEMGYAVGSMTLPDWSARELLEAVVEATGWSLVARYDPYPSTGLTVRFVAAGAALPDPSTLPALDARVAKGGWAEAADTERAGTRGVRMANALRQETPSSAIPRVYSGAIPRVTEPAPPPTRAVLALSNWSFKRTEGKEDGVKPRVDDLMESVFALVDVGSARFGSPQTDLEQHPDLGGAPYFETRVWGYPSVGQAAYLVSVVDADVEGDGVPRPVTLWGRMTPPGVSPAIASPVWAGALYEMRSGPATSSELAKGDFYVNGIDIRPGDPTAAVALGGHAWTVRDTDRRLVDELAALTLERPESRTIRLPAAPGALPGAVEALSVSYRAGWGSVANSPGGSPREYVFRVFWEPPPVEQSRVLYYELRSRLADGEFAAWFALYTTSYIAGAVDGDVRVFEVRAVGDGEIPGPSSSISITANAVNNEAAR